jgi:penicillin amidase
MLRVIGLSAGGAALLVVIVAAGWFASWRLVRGEIRTGSIVVPGLSAPVTIARDARGVAHVSAATVDDAFFGQGYAVAADRLFQMDLLRRFVSGELSEIFGPPALDADREARVIMPRALARRGYAVMSPYGRRALDAFARGVNAAMQNEPLPAEFNALVYRPRPWLPEDSLLVGIATILDLTHDWNDILVRQRVNDAIGARGAEALNPLSDPYYDAPLAGTVAPIACRPPLRGGATAAVRGDALPALSSLRAPAEASNNWAAGGAHTTNGHAFVANDPHLSYRVPGVWHLVELQAPGLHVVGAALPGVPGVLLGHNERIAWGATNATVSTVTVYREKMSEVRDAGSERITVRFGRPATVTHERTSHGFVFLKDAHAAYAAAWVNARDPRSPLDTFLSLDRAGSAPEAFAILRSYVGPPQNFVVGDVEGRAGYHMAGFIPNDGVWSTRVVDGATVADAWHGYVPFDDLPHVDPSRDAVVYTANNRVWGSTERYRLTDSFTPAFRARRIAEALRSRKRFSVDDFRRIQLDELSLADRDFARAAVARLRSKPALTATDRVAAHLLEGWDGRMSPDSRTATLAFRMRDAAVHRFARAVLGDELGAAWIASVGTTQATDALLCALRSSPLLLDRLGVSAPADGVPPWREAGRTPLTHPLHAFGITAFDAPALPGGGDFASPKVQTQRFGQSFRAVWDIGAWSNGGMTLPLGESGRMNGAHAADQERPYVRGELLPMPFGAPVSTESTLRLVPVTQR